MATYQHVNGVMEDFEANKVACTLTPPPTISFSHALLTTPCHLGPLR